MNTRTPSVMDGHSLMNGRFPNRSNISPPLPKKYPDRVLSLKSPTFLYSLGFRRCGDQFTRCSLMLLSGRSNRGNLHLGPLRSFSALLARIFASRSIESGVVVISGLDFPSSLPSQCWFRAPVCTLCPGLESYKYLDVCSCLSPASVLESQASPVY